MKTIYRNKIKASSLFIVYQNIIFISAEYYISTLKISLSFRIKYPHLALTVYSLYLNLDYMSGMLQI